MCIRDSNRPDAPLHGNRRQPDNHLESDSSAGGASRNAAPLALGTGLGALWLSPLREAERA
eukprot:8491608-Alexandrium_andersonii.AAC.1